jgi:CRISPR-associated protein Cmx8
MNQSDETTLTLEYDLHALPTAQHKAGLAGLLLMIESMRLRKMSPLPVVTYDASKATVSLTMENLQSVFDDLYDASWIEVTSKSKWKNKSPKREVTSETENPDGKPTKAKSYVYDQYVPKGEFLKSLLPVDGDLWLKLWRDMLWETLRGRPTTRRVYEERADNRPSSEGRATWAALIRSAQRRTDGKTLTDGIASSLFIGAQNSNAEGVPFQGTVEDNLLLNFWHIASLTFVPRLIRKNQMTRVYQAEETGYVLAVPEPANLRDFVADALHLIRSLDTERSGFRPRSSSISVPEESGLEYIYRLAGSRLGQKEISYSLAGVEIYHLEKRGNNIVTLANVRLSADEQVLIGYAGIRSNCRNPLFRGQRIKNLLSQTPWYTGMDTVFHQYSSEFFTSDQGKTPRTIPFFGYDVARTVNSIENNLRILDSTKGGNPMSAEVHDDRLASCVYQMTREYVNRRTEEKSGAKYDDFKKNKDSRGRVVYPQQYREAREKVCSDAFLAMRSRRESDFVEYFTGTICSVAQYLPEQDYLIVSQSLITQSDTVKTLAMLALSASSAVGRASEDETTEQGGEQ